jgi:7,8-dihydro-6-hydroxymethylpterin-pyrophosphokinase
MWVMTIKKWSETIHMQEKKAEQKNKRKKESKRIDIGLVVFILQTTNGGGCHTILAKMFSTFVQPIEKLQIKHKRPYITYF